MAQLLKGVQLVTATGARVEAAEFLANKVVAIYFSASWCPPCRQFTPKLKHYYDTLKAAGKPFEVVYVSRDRDEEALQTYYKDHHGAWTHLAFGDPKIQELLTKFEVKTIPTLRLVKPDGKVVIVDARTEVQEKGQENPTDLWDEWLAFYDA